ncbi:MAG: hypothetical protein VX246_07710, partial [Myxococcota bacterium]|nr:hypothetical protein [Myxococcota bacterium]
KTRSSFETETSICSWDLDPELVRQAAEAAAVQERDAVARRDYDLASDPDLRAWLMANVRPVIEEYVGCRAIEPWGVIRYANASGEGEPWPSYEAKHAYEEFHFDELCYMQRIILYLNDVDEGCGPFLYVDGSDRMEQNLVVRTFHQAVDACGFDFYTEAGRRSLARLPGLFRGSDIVGRHTGPGPFESSRLVQATGPAGRLILFDGFQLVHAGGFPATATRKALFIAFRFPRKKVGDLAATAVRRLTARKFARWAG